MDSPAQKPLGCVLESENCADYNPVTSPFLYLPFIVRAFPERLERLIGRQEKVEPRSEDGWSVNDSNRG